MIRSELLEACIKDMVDCGHIMESCDYESVTGETYRIKFQKLKKNIPTKNKKGD